MRQWRRDRGGGNERWSSFKARWVWIILKMGQEEEEERGGGGERSSSIKSPPPCLLCLSFLWQRTDAVTWWGQSIVRAITKQTSNDTVGQKVGPIKIKSMNTILTVGENTHPYFHFSLERYPQYISQRDVMGENTCSTASTYFNQFPGAGFHRSLADNTLRNNATVCFSKPTWQAAWQWGSASTCHVSPLIGHKDLPPWNLVVLHTSSQGLQTKPF